VRSRIFYIINPLITNFIKAALKIACLFNSDDSASGELRPIPLSLPGLRPWTPLGTILGRRSSSRLVSLVVIAVGYYYSIPIK